MLSEERLREIVAEHQPGSGRWKVGGEDIWLPACNNDLCDNIWPCESYQMAAELLRLRPVVEAAQGWHTTREAIAKLDQISGSEWFIQVGVAMRAHQQAADKLAAVVAALAGEGER